MGMDGAYQPAHYPIFRKMDPYVLPGISLATILLASLALAVGLAAFAASGMLTRPVEADAGWQALSEDRLRLSECYYAIVEADMAENPQAYGQAESAHLESVIGQVLEKYPADARDGLIREGLERGISAQMGIEDVQLLATGTVVEYEPVIPDFQRLIICLVPCICVIALRFEVHGVSLQREIRQLRQFARRTHAYIYRREGEGSDGPSGASEGGEGQ